MHGLFFQIVRVASGSLLLSSSILTLLLNPSGEFLFLFLYFSSIISIFFLQTSVSLQRFSVVCFFYVFQEDLLLMKHVCDVRCKILLR